MGKKHEIIADYRKQMQELVDACTNTATEFANPIRKEAVSQLMKIGQDVFKALKTLESENVLAVKCKKCGSMGICGTCGSEITLVSITPE